MFNTQTTNHTVYTECLDKYTLEPGLNLDS